MPQPKYNQLITTALDLFRNYGFKRVTVEEICQTADVSKMTFYKYFQNKIDLGKTIVNVIWEESETEFNDIINSDMEFPEKVTKIVNLKMEKSQAYSDDFLQELQGGIPELKQMIMERYQSYMQRLVEFFKSGQKSGHVRPDIPDAFFPYILMKMSELTEDKYLSEIFTNRSTMITELTEFFFYGISADGK